MKQKPAKQRSSSNGQQERRRGSITTIGIFDTTTISSKKVDLGTGTVHLDSHTACLKGHSTIKSQKALKRDLLRCSDQRPSLLGPQTLQPPRMQHGSQHAGYGSGSSSVDRQQPARRRSLSVNSRTFYATIDRIGPWPDISISRLRSDGNEFLRPLKNFRSLKNPRVFSPKYYAALTENTSKFKFYSSTKNYIEEYRKQKGYLLNPRAKPLKSSVALSTVVPVQETEEEQVSVVGEFSSGGVDLNNGTVADRTMLPTADFVLPMTTITKSIIDFAERLNTTPSIPSVTKVFNEPHYSTNFPTITMRNGHVRASRRPPHHAAIAQQTQHQQAIVLPSLASSSLHYISSMSSVEKAYSNSKKPPMHSQSKLIFIEGRRKKKSRPPQRIHSEGEGSPRSQDYPELCATGSTVVTSAPQRLPAAVVVYQLPRRPPPLVVSRSDVESLT